MSAPRILIGPANYAGQADGIARAVSRSDLDFSGASASLTKSNHAISFDADISLPRWRWALDPMWKARWRSEVKRDFQAVLIDGGLPLTRGGIAKTAGGRISLARSGLREDVHDLSEAGLKIGLLFHGSEIRSPAAHMEREPRSPFRSMPASEVKELEDAARHVRAVSLATGCSTFVTTPDLLLDCPDAVWLPVVVDVNLWRVERPPTLSPRPTVLHVPSSAAFAGSSAIDSVLQELHREGVIEYVRAAGVRPREMRALVTGADIVLDKVGLGLYGVLAVEAMAAGRLVMGYVSAQVRREVARTGSEVPVLDIDTGDFERQLRDVVLRPHEFARLAARGPNFVATVHSGDLTAERLIGSLISRARG